MNRRHIARNFLLYVILSNLVVCFVLSAAVILWQWKGIPLGNLTRDPSNILNSPFYLGAISSFGIMLWTATATLCIFTGTIGRHTASNSDICNFLVASGLFTAALMLDDLFLFHEKFFPYYLHIPEYAVYSIYLLTGVAFFLFFRKFIFQTNFLMLFAAAFFLGLSIVADTLTNNIEDTSIKFLIEDGLKLFGIMNWFMYYVHLCIGEINAQIKNQIH